MHCLKRLDESVMARTFERQVVELHGIRPANPSTSNEELQAPGVHVNHRAHHVARDPPFALLCPPHAPGLQRAIQG